MKYNLAFLTSMFLLVSCSGTRDTGNKEKMKVVDSDPICNTECYQKELPYEGLSGSIDSVRIRVYMAHSTTDKKDYEIGEFIGAGMKTYDNKGFLMIDQYQAYQNGRLASANMVANHRNKESLLDKYTSSYMTNEGRGHTLVFDLRQRAGNEEIWECVSKRDGQDLNVTAIVLRFSNNTKQVFEQVSADSDSLRLIQEYIFDDKSRYIGLRFYNLGTLSKEIINEYNEYGLIDKTTTILVTNNTDYETEELNESFEYEYDEMNNPIAMKAYVEGEIQAVFEYKIYYRGK